MKDMLAKMDLIIDESQAIFDTYMKKYGQFSNMTRSVYISLVEQCNVRKRLEEMYKEEELNERLETSEKE